MKKAVVWIFFVLTLFSLSACTSKAEEEWHNSDEYKELMEGQKEMEEIIERSEENIEHLNELWDEYEDKFGSLD